MCKGVVSFLPLDFRATYYLLFHRTSPGMNGGFSRVGKSLRTSRRIQLNTLARISLSTSFPPNRLSSKAKACMIYMLHKDFASTQAPNCLKHWSCPKNVACSNPIPHAVEYEMDDQVVKPGEFPTNTLANE